MKIYTLKTTIGGKTTEQKLSDGKPIQIQSQQDAQYELVDENGNVLQPIKENDTWTWLNPENEEVVVQIEHYQPSKLATVSESHAIAPEVIPVKSAVLASEIGIGKAVLWGLGGLLGAGGIALAASGGKGGGGSNNQDESNKPKLSDTNNTVTENINKKESAVIKNHGEVTSSEKEEKPNLPKVNQPSTSINTKETSNSTETHEATINNSHKEESFVRENATETKLSEKEEKTNKLKVDESSISSGSAESTNSTVTNKIATPIIHFDPITEDNIINLAESQSAVRISGHVEHANEGDIVHFRIGEAQYTAELAQGKFSVNVDGQTLANHHSISATVQTHNQEGNATATGTAQKEYEVDIIAPQPTLVLDNIAGDNVVNRTEAAGKIQISGVTTEVADGAKVVVACGCPSCLARLGVEALEKTAVVTSGRFSVEFDGSDLVADGRHIITARVLVQDKAGNVGEAEDNKGYSVEITHSEASVVWDNIASDNIINQQESQNNVTLSGRISNVKEGDKVQVRINIGNEVLEATVDNGHYSVSVDGNKLVSHPPLEAVLSITDKFGNTTTKNIQHQYDVDTAITSPTIQIAPINQGNSLNQQQSLSAVTISGTLTLDSDIDLARTKVTVIVHGESYPATINGNHWQAVVPGHKLAKAQGENTVSVKVVATDDAGNTVENTAVTTYQVDTIAPTAEIKLNPIAGDGILEHGEKSQNHTVSGTVSGEFKVGDEITLNINGHTKTAVIEQGGRFQVDVSGAQLAAKGEHNVKAELHLRDQAGNESTIHTNKSYQVKDAPQPEVQPEPETSATPETNVEAEREPEPTIPTQPEVVKPTTEIHLNNIAPEVMEDSDFIRLSGKVKLEGAFTHGHNEHRLHAVTIKIGEKSYRSAVDPQTQKFVVDIPESDLPFIQGKEVRYLFDTDKQIYELGPSEYADYYARPINTPTLDSSHIILDENMPIAGNLFNLAADKRSYVEISGKVSGDVQAGEKLILSIGDKQFETTVNTNLNFRHTVPKELLADNDRVKVVLQRNDASAEVLLSKAPELSGKFVSKHELDPYTDGGRPYFINALLMEGNQTRYPIYHKERLPLVFDHPVVMRYNILNGYHSFEEKDIEGVKKALNIISAYTNIHFEKTDSMSLDDVELRFYLRGITRGTATAYTEHINDAEVSSVYMGTRLLNGRTLSLSDDYPLNVLLHEILHALGGKHPHEGRALMPWVEDSRPVSLLSYKDRYLATPQLGIFDIAFLHYRYGVNQNVRKGNDVYRFRPASDHSVERDVYIWDGGGVDTFDASDQTQSVNVNLTPGSWIYSGQKTDTFLMTEKHTTLYDANAYFEKSANVRINGGVGFLDLNHYTKGQAFIGYGTQIEKLIGSDFNDTLTGNNADNTIYGGKGNDIINGGGGNDYLDGGLGVDTLSGGIGDDIYVVNENRDSVRENADEGNDTVHSYINYTLTSNVENLSLFGAENLSATGNNLNNIIIGNNSDNRLDGKEGTDTLTGGKGRDTFIFSSSLNGEIDTITDFTVGEDKIGLSRDIFLSIRTENDIHSHIHYEKATGKLFYSQDTIGKGTHFATISSNLLIDEQSFMLV
ncbi:Ig-like domain-containing protein [Haemophilus haemoglobinophilus]|nr:Ig-like domain-containing protein [Canicola haemoglobinophilus]